MAKLDSIDSFAEQTAVMDEYKRKGFVKSDKDGQALHMSFSPRRVPKGLTKLQVRRRVNKYWRGGYKQPSLRDILGNRINIFLNDKFVMGISTTNKFDTEKEQIKFFQELVKFMKAPRKLIAKAGF